MYKIASADQFIKGSLADPKIGLSKEIYKTFTKPGEEKKTYSTADRLLMAGLAGLTASGAGYGISRLLNKNKKTIPLALLAAPAFAAATTGFFHPELRNATIDYHGHKDDKKLKEEVKRIILRKKDIEKKAGIVGGIARGTGTALSTVGRTVWNGLKFGGKPTTGQKITRFITKGTALGGLGYGAYKGYEHLAKPRSEGNYTTFLRNNILAGNISGNEVTDNEKKQIDELGMR